MSSPSDLPYRANLRPLCPDDYHPMHPEPDSSGTFRCTHSGCRFLFARHIGYYTLERGVVVPPPDTIRLLRPALIREHGYLFISEIDFAAKTRTWRCTVKDCPNTLTDDLS